MQNKMKKVVRPIGEIIKYKRGMPRIARSINMPKELFDRVQADADSWMGGNFSKMMTQIVAEYYMYFDQSME